MHRAFSPRSGSKTACGVDPASARARFALEWLLPLASALLSVVLLTGLMAGLALLVGFPISGIEVVVAVAVTGVGLAFWLFRIHGRGWPVPCALIVVALAAVIFPDLVLGGRVLDDTWDGQWFHQEAVIQFADGWNPFREDLTSIEVPNEGARVRLNGYPKATWLWGASLYQLTQRIERAKAFSFPLMVAAGLVVLACLLVVTRLHPAVAFIVAIVAAANPVAVTQILNAFQDGALASLLTIVVASLVLWVATGSRVGLVLATGAAVGAASVKLTGPIFVAIIVISAVVWLWWNGRWRDQRRAFGIALALAVMGTLILSGGAYVTNAVRHGHPLYPVFGPDSSPIVTAPPHSRFQALVASLVVRSQLSSNDAESISILQNWQGLKLPYSVDSDEFDVFFYPNVRIGGWGPLTSGVVLLTILLFSVTATRRPRWAAAVVVAAAPIALSVLVNPYCWKARYVPQSWLIPLLIAVMILASESRRLERILAGAVLVTALINAALVSWAHFPAVVDHSITLKTKLLALGQRREQLDLDLQPFRSNRVRLAELGIRFNEVDDHRHSLPVFLGYSSVRITRVDVEPAAEGGGLARVAWKATPGIDDFLVEVVVPSPAGPGGSVLTVVRRPADLPGAEIPVPTGPFKVAVSECNRIGCGVADVESAVFRGGGERRRPMLGVPHEGEIVRQSLNLFSWLPATGTSGQPARYRFSLLKMSTGALVYEGETDDLWLAHRFAEDGSWLAQVSLVGSGSDDVSEVVFHTEGVATPRLVQPPSGSTRAAGGVELVWEPVPGVSSYEYFVAITGQAEATTRGVTEGTHAVVGLTALNGHPTGYSIIVRACLALEGCRAGTEIGWGPWSHEAGFGDLKLTVVP